MADVTKSTDKLADASSQAPTEAPSAYRVIVPLVITKKPDRSDLYVYEGGLLPVYVEQAEADRLLAEHFVEKVPAGTLSAPTAESN